MTEKISEMNQKLNGWKTIITAGLIIAIAALSAFGVQIPGVDNIINETTDASIIIISAVFTVLRAVTDSPVGWKR